MKIDVKVHFLKPEYKPSDVVITVDLDYVEDRIDVREEVIHELYPITKHYVYGKYADETVDNADFEIVNYDVIDKCLSTSSIA